MALPPPRTAEIYYDSAWHPVSVREADTVSITRGLSGTGTRAEPTAAGMTLGNRNGELSVYDPTSAVYGKVGRNTSLRFAVTAGGPRAVLPGDTTSALKTPDHPSFAVGDLDLRVDLASDDYTLSQELAERWVATGGQRSWSLAMVNQGQVTFRWSPNGTTEMYAGTLARIPAHSGQRLTVRVTLDVDNGRGGWTLRFYWATSVNASVWHLIEEQSGSGTTAVFDGTAGVTVGSVEWFVGNGIKGRLYGLQLRNGIGGPLVLDLDLERDASVTDTSVTDGTGRVWSLAGAAVLSNRHVRIDGEVPAWPPERHISGGDSVVKVAPAGILRRLGTGVKPLPSALRRAIVAAGPIECWPLTDGPESTAGAPLVGTVPMRSQGGNSRFSWGKGSVAEWIEPVLQADSGGASTMLAVIPRAAAAAAGWAVDWVRAGGGRDPGPELFHFQDTASGGVSWVWTVQTDPPNGRVSVYVSDSETGDGPDFVTVDAPEIYDGRPHHLRLHVFNVGGVSSSWRLYIDGQERGSGSWTSPTTPLSTVVCVYVLNLLDGAPAVSTGYLTYWGSSPPPAADMYAAMIGHAGETAGDRILRVCAEQGVPAGCLGDPDDSEPLGAQQMAAFLDVLEDASKADLGLLLDRRDTQGLLYRTRASLYSQEPRVTLDFSSGVIRRLVPKEPDRLIRNEITVTRAGGSEHTAVQETGPMSVQDPPVGIGRYDEGVTLGLATDAQTVDQAWWRLHLGTVDGLRYPQVVVDLANPRVGALLADILAADVGDVLRLQNLPPEYGPGDVTLLIRGYTEDIGPDVWRITFVCDPGGPWTVGVLGDRVLGRADTAGCVLGAAVDADDTTLLLVTTTGPEWIRTATHAAQFPFSLTLGGEEVLVNSLTGVIEDSFARSVTSGWGSADSGQAWTRAGGGAADFSVAGGVGIHSAATRNVLRATTAPVPVADVDVRADISMSQVPAGGSAEIHLMARRLSSADFYSARLLVAAGGALTLSLRKLIGNADTQLATYATGLTLAAGTGYTVRLSVQGSTLRAKIWPAAEGELGEPSLWQLTATDTSLTQAGLVGVRTLLATATTNVLPLDFRFDNVGSLPQLAAVTRSANGVVKPQTAGEKVALTHPMIVAL